MSNPTDEIATAKALATKLQEQFDALYARQKANLEQDGLGLRVPKLQTDIAMAKTEIERRATVAQLRGGKPEVGDLLRTLKEKGRELEELEAKYGRPKRWWEFWK